MERICEWLSPSLGDTRHLPGRTPGTDPESPKPVYWPPGRDLKPVTPAYEALLPTKCETAAVSPEGGSLLPKRSGLC